MLIEEVDFGSVLGERDTDYVLAKIPDPFFKYAGIQYNQREVDAYSCTIHGSAGAITDLTGYEYSTEELQKLWAKALTLGAREGFGWSASGAVDLLRKEWNRKHDKKLLSFRIERTSDKFWEVMEKGYSCVVAFRANADYNRDKNADGDLDQTNWGVPTYGHIVRIALVGSQLTVIDNYKGIKYNTYTIPRENWAKLQNYYPSAYVYIGEDEYRTVNGAYQEIPTWAATAWEEHKHLFDDPQPSKPITLEQWPWIFHKLGYIEKPSEPMTQARLAVLLSRIFYK